MSWRIFQIIFKFIIMQHFFTISQWLCRIYCAGMAVKQRKYRYKNAVSYLWDWCIMFCFNVCICIIAVRQRWDIFLHFFDSSGLTAYGMAEAVFVWFRYHDWSFLEKEKVRRTIKAMSGASFGIYLIQMRIIALLIWENPKHNGIRRMMVGAVGIYLICMAIVLIVKKS